MSKLGRLNLQLQEQAEALGFSTTQEALDAGYGVDYDKAGLIEPEKAAHEAWVKEKGRIIDDLYELRMDFAKVQYQDQVNTIDRTLNFLKGVSHE